MQDTDERRELLKEEYVHDGAQARRTLHDFAESNYIAQLSFVRKNPKNEGIIFLIFMTMIIRVSYDIFGVFITTISCSFIRFCLTSTC